MIIEFFGPPGVGKTTLAHALINRLRSRGRDIRPVLSNRPAEVACGSRGGSGRHHAAARRVLRSLASFEFPATLGRTPTGPNVAGVPTELMRLLPPKDILWRIRLRQHLLRLSRCWSEAALNPQVALFDQGFIQAVCSLVLLARKAEPDEVALALRAIPKPDLMIKLQAPRHILARRLAERERRQGRLERILEFDLQTNLDSIRVIEQLDGFLSLEGRSALCVDSADRGALECAVGRIEAELASIGELDRSVTR